MADALDRLAPVQETGALDGLGMAELRRRRNTLQEGELALSYVRRQVQVRLDIVLDELAHRRAGAPARDTRELVAELPKILADRGGGTARGAFNEVAIPPDAVEAVVADLDRILDTAALGSLEGKSDAELGLAADEFGAIERRVSQRRRLLHTAIDALQEEMLRRYKSGEASVDALLP